MSRIEKFIELESKLAVFPGPYLKNWVTFFPSDS